LIQDYYENKHYKFFIIIFDLENTHRPIAPAKKYLTGKYKLRRRT
jgi:hypothetical protein